MSQLVVPINEAVVSVVPTRVAHTVVLLMALDTTVQGLLVVTTPTKCVVDITLELWNGWSTPLQKPKARRGVSVGAAGEGVVHSIRIPSRRIRQLSGTGNLRAKLPLPINDPLMSGTLEIVRKTVFSDIG